MAQKPKAGGAKKPPAKKTTKTEKPQSERFIDAARSVGVSKKEFESLVDRMLSQDRPGTRRSPPGERRPPAKR